MNETNINQPVKGLNMDLHPTNLDSKNSYTHALNVRQESEDGGSINLTNESSTTLSTTLPKTVIGTKVIPEISKTIYFLTDGTNHEIGYVANTEHRDNIDDTNDDDPVCCGTRMHDEILEEPLGLSTKEVNKYVRIVSSPCLNFSKDHPILEVEYKLTSESTEIYWTDNYNPMRWLDINNVPYLEGTTNLDCNSIRVFPEFRVPLVKLEKNPDVGSLRAGSYQFFVAYANSKGEEISEYYSATNHGAVWDNQLRPELSFETTKSIKVVISELDTKFKYINIAVGETINNTTEWKLVGNFDITSEVFEYVYTGNNKLLRPLTREDIFFRYPFYKRAGTVAAQGKLLMWGDLEGDEEVNYQSIASKISLQWETWKVPHNKYEGYNNAANISNLRSYMRDEVYAFEAAFILKSGRITQGFHIPGPVAKQIDFDAVTNEDADNTVENPCEGATTKARWEVYNTAQVSGYTEEYLSSVSNPVNCKDIVTTVHTATTSTETNTSEGVFDQTIPGVVYIQKGQQLPSDTRYYSKITIELAQTYAHDIEVEFAYVIPNPDIFTGGNVAFGWEDGMIENFPTGTIPKQDNAKYPWKVTIPAGQTVVSVQGLPTVTGASNNAWLFYPAYTEIDIRIKCNTANFMVSAEDDSGILKPLAADFIYNKEDDCGIGPDGSSTTTTTNVNTSTRTETICFPDPCYVGAYQYGDFAYWQSSESYDQNKDIWGDLAGQPIRHHKFPDSIISPHFSWDGEEYSIYPVGVRLDPSNIEQAIKESNLPQHIKDEIVGIKLLRANRVNNKTVVAKGLLYNVGSYNRDGQKFFYPNYPFNDVSADPYLSSEKIQRTGKDIPGPQESKILSGFVGDDSKTRFTLHSPDTSFTKQGLSGLLKIEGVMSGKADAHIIKVLDNARYTIGTAQGVKMAVTLALSTVLSMELGGGSSGGGGNVIVNLNNFTSSFQQAYDLINKLIPFRDYGYQYNAVGNYTKMSPVPEGNTLRNLELVGHIDSGLLNVGDTNPVNNFQRESSVYLKTTAPLAYTHEVGGIKDNSRFNFHSYNKETGIWLEEGERVKRDISSYYASIKKVKPDQYGRLYSYLSMDTGWAYYLDSELRPPTAFGGDIFINPFGLKRKLPFFLTNTVNQPDNSDVMLNELGNVAFPTYYITTGPIKYELTNDVRDAFDKAYKKATQTDFGSGLLAAISGGNSRFVPVLQAIIKLTKEIIDFLGIKDINLDRHVDKGYYEEGVMYMFAYGIPYFFVESDVNLDYRQAENGTDKNFFPNVGTDIPDFWLQESTVSIAKDNHYLYNRDFSLQNLENYFGHLSKDWDPKKKNIKYHTTRVIYSEPTTLEEKLNNWLVYRANNYYDFPLTNGRLISIRGIEQEKVLARFENKTSIYNSYITLDTDNKTAITGTGAMFSTPPLEFPGTSGTQHKAFCTSKFGHFWVDAKRGEVFQLDQGIKEISHLGIRNWLKENLPFNITKSFKDYPVDNSYKDVGLCMTWDNRFERIFVTKKDYKPIKDNIIYEDGKFYVTTTTSEQDCALVDCCPVGFNQVGDKCVGTVYTPATAVPGATPFVASKKGDSNYARSYSCIYSTFNQNGTGTYTIINQSNPYWKNIAANGTDGPFNRTAIWNSLGDGPFNTWVGVPIEINVPASKTYYIGIGADDYARVNLDCETILEYDVNAMYSNHPTAGLAAPKDVSYKIWHIFPVTIPAGRHILEIQDTNTGGPGAFGCQIYDNTPDEIMSATSNSDLNIILDTANYVGQELNMHMFECPGEGCYSVIERDGEYVCASVQEQDTTCRMECFEVEKVHKTLVDIKDPNYFCETSWTLAYSPLSESWVSFYSFLPDYYIEQQSYFQSGKDSTTWDHLLTNKSYQVFYNKFYPYEVETITKQDITSDVLVSVSYRADVQRYVNSYDWKYMKYITFTECIISSTTQTSGLLVLNVKDKNNLYEGLTAELVGQSISIPVSCATDTWSFNKFSDVTRDHNSKEPLFNYTCSNSNKLLNESAIDYTRYFDMSRKTRLRSDWFKIKLRNTQHSRYKFIFKWLVNREIKSR